ncbi:MAG: hypothetical protein NC336_05255 [Clostridium sp.]|nr:hypothetical protein [Clostridium sp.]
MNDIIFQLWDIIKTEPKEDVAARLPSGRIAYISAAKRVRKKNRYPVDIDLDVYPEMCGGCDLGVALPGGNCACLKFQIHEPQGRPILVSWVDQPETDPEFNREIIKWFLDSFGEVDEEAEMERLDVGDAEPVFPLPEITFFKEDGEENLKK